MVRWDKDKVIDLACIEGITVQEIAERLGVHKASVERFLSRNRAELFAARNETAVSDVVYGEVMDLWGESVPREEIAARVGVSTAVVRRLIMSAEYDEQPAELGASLELMALRLHHPDRLYEDDARALTSGVVQRFSAPDAGLRRAA